MSTQPPDTQQPTEYTDERIAELRKEFALPDPFNPNTFPPTKTKGMKACISGMARNGKRFIDEGEYDTAKGYFEFFDDMAHQLNQGYYDAAVIINKLLAEIERLQKLVLAFHSADEKPEARCGYAFFNEGNGKVSWEWFGELCNANKPSVLDECGKLLGYCYDYDANGFILSAFESWMKQKGAGA